MAAGGRLSLFVISLMLLSSLNRTIRYSTRQVRGLAAVTAAPDTIPFQIFDRQTKRIQRDTAALKHAGTASRTVDYLRDEVADRMVERLEDIKRKFKTVLDLGSGPGHFAKLIETSKAEKCIMVDSSCAFKIFLLSSISHFL